MKNFIVRWQFVKRQGPFESTVAAETEEQAKEVFLSNPAFKAADLKQVEIDRIDSEESKVQVKSETDVES